jgi:hypothetical protein
VDNGIIAAIVGYGLVGSAFGDVRDRNFCASNGVALRIGDGSYDAAVYGLA